MSASHSAVRVRRFASEKLAAATRRRSVRAIRVRLQCLLAVATLLSPGSPALAQTPALRAAAGAAATNAPAAPAPAAPDPGAATPDPGAGPVQPVTDGLSVASIAARIESMQASPALGEPARTRVLELLRLASASLAAEQADRAATASFEEALERAPLETAQLVKTLEEGGGVATPSVASLQLPENADLAALSQALDRHAAEVALARSNLEALEKRIAELKARPQAARAALAGARAALSETESALAALPAAAEASPVLAAQRLELRARERARRAEVARLDVELRSQAVRLAQLVARRNVEANRLESSEARVKLLERIVAERRKAEAERARAAAEQTQLDAVGKHPAIQALAERIANLSAELQTVVANLETVNASRLKVSAELERLATDFARVRQRIEVAGLSAALSEVLREQRRRLPNVRQYRKTASQRAREIAAAGLGRLRVDERAEALNDIETALADWMAGRVAPDLDAELRAPVRVQLRFLLVDEQALVDELAVAYASLTQALGDLDFDERRMVAEVERYAAYLNERMLWVPSASPVNVQTLTEAAAAGAWLLDPRHWRTALSETLVSLRGDLRLLLGAMFLVVLVALRPRLIAALRHTADRVGHYQSDRFRVTLSALGITVLLTLPWPAALAYSGWAFDSGATSEFAHAVAGGFVAAGRVILPLLFLRNLCRPRGVCVVHFRWSPRSVRLIRRHAAWFAIVAGATAFVIGTMVEVDEQSFRTSLGRLVLVAGELGLALFVYLLLNPRTGIPRDFILRAPESWTAKLQYAWLGMGIGLPVGLAGVALAGYWYTAAALQFRINITVWSVVGAFLLHSLVLRWVWVTSRRLELKAAREQRMAAMDDADRPEQADGEAADALDLDSIDVQTRRLVATLLGWSVVVGLWIAWSDVLPALSFLDTVTLWQLTEVVDGKSVLTRVTLTSLLVAALTAGLVIAAARNLPGVLEIALLRRLPIDAGARHAITATAQYLIVGIGMVVVFDFIGLAWSDIQWLVAALSVGLGFGLQEIVANFVSGLIILFERPVRIGDTVTVGDLTGNVTRIRIRATTITDWDNKEIIVPNKTFITERLVNWTLTDSVTRVVVPVGVAYGSDTALAHALLLRAAEEHPMVLSEPAPVVYFVGLGASSLDFEVRFHVRWLRERLEVTHDFLMAIERRLAEHGIGIPFPQRDLHIRSAEGLDLVGRHAGATDLAGTAGPPAQSGRTPPSGVPVRAREVGEADDDS